MNLENQFYDWCQTTLKEMQSATDSVGGEIRDDGLHVFLCMQHYEKINLLSVPKSQWMDIALATGKKIGNKTAVCALFLYVATTNADKALLERHLDYMVARSKDANTVEESLFWFKLIEKAVS